MSGLEIKELKEHLRVLANLLKLTQVDQSTWESKYKTRYISTTHGFVLETSANRESHNIQIIIL